MKFIKKRGSQHEREKRADIVATEHNKFNLHDYI